jgi:hypothetical protein
MTRTMTLLEMASGPRYLSVSTFLGAEAVKNVFIEAPIMMDGIT